MPTIDQLEAAVVASDDDVFPVSQSGTARRITRAQLLAGTQASLDLTPGLLGRVSTGLGPPQPVAIGGGLSLTNGILSGTLPYSAAALPASGAVSLTDLVPVWQNGQDHTVNVRTLLSTPGIDVSSQFAVASSGNLRHVSDWIGDTIAAEAFGAVGDGVTDDTVALNSAIASGRPVLLGAKTYRVDGQWNVQTTAVLIGTAGLTRLKRSSQAGGAWIAISGQQFVARNIIFDAGSLSGDSWGVLVAASCVSTTFQNCRFQNTTGSTLGTGLTIQARDGLAGLGSAHTIVDCAFLSNSCHGLWIQAAAGADVRGCLAVSNGGYGICLDYNDPTFQQVVRQSSVRNCRSLNNSRGISIGNYNSTNLEPPRWGLDHPDAIDIAVTGNICVGNTAYGIAVSGARLQVKSNQVIMDGGPSTASGILCNASMSVLDGNVVAGPGQFGIDAGGSADLVVTNNAITACAVGINAGGSVRVQVDGNRLVGNQRSITVFQVETDGNGANFGLACSDIWIEGNIIQTDGGCEGVFLLDGPQRVDIVRNRFFSASADTGVDLIWCHTDDALIAENVWNAAPASVSTIASASGSSQLIVPEVLDHATIASSVTRVDAITGSHQSAMSGVISFIRVTNGGTGYSTASVAIAGSGSGASATAYIRDGAIIGIALISGGGSYDAATTVTVSGDGRGATARATVGIPPGRSRRLRLECLGPVVFTQNSASANWTQADVTVPAGAAIVWESSTAGWQATQFSNIDYLLPNGDGSVSLRSVSGDLRLRPGPSGSVRVCSQAEPTGYTSCFGRGSPEGVIAAPPGSDYRNLDGGSGTTMWSKRSGAGSTGWFATA